MTEEYANQMARRDTYLWVKGMNDSAGVIPDEATTNAYYQSRLAHYRGGPRIRLYKPTDEEIDKWVAGMVGKARSENYLRELGVALGIDISPEAGISYTSGYTSFVNAYWHLRRTGIAPRAAMRIVRKQREVRKLIESARKRGM